MVVDGDDGFGWTPSPGLAEAVGAAGTGNDGAGALAGSSVRLHAEARETSIKYNAARRIVSSALTMAQAGGALKSARKQAR